MVRILIDPATGTIQVGEWVYSLAVLAAGRVAPLDRGIEPGGDDSAAGAAAGEAPAGEGNE